MSPSILTGVPPTIESVSPGRDMPGSADDRDLLSSLLQHLDDLDRADKLLAHRSSPSAPSGHSTLPGTYSPSVNFMIESLSDA
jgi:hypothetical protein